ncbi:MAG: FG-GAP-like repeat-containing protein, partial [Candidatus Cloacimonetes bacterium]|nr:FG-GAP-like repeat-containing protein [Candidatus Cloacimonadota bacterium]
MKKLLVFYLISMLIISVSAQSIEFREHIVEDYIDGPTCYYICDIDNDGDNDIAGSCGDAGVVCWWRNEGGDPIVWNLQYIDNDFNGAIYVHAEDIDGDGNIDVISAAWESNEIAWWKNDGNDPITWTKQTLQDDFHHAHEVDATDIDSDGNIDIFGVAAADNEIAWWKNNGEYPIQWTKQTIVSDFIGARSVEITDVNGDGLKDVVGAALDDDEIAWWENNGEQPIIWTKHIVTDDFNLAHKVNIYDFNDDNHPDILGASHQNWINWWENDGNNPVNWIEHQVTDSFNDALIAYANDLDFDGDLDVFGTGFTSDQVSWWESNGEYPFEWQEYKIDTDLSHAFGIHYGDLDGDGDIDIVAGGVDEDVVRWYENSYYSIKFSATPLTGHFPLEVTFTDESNFIDPILTWSWDFDNDGEIDSNEQNPTFTYDEPGTYSVSLITMTESFLKSIVYEDYIQVFNGESALYFAGDGYAMCDATESLNFSNEFTFEAWINPT